jgi:isopentenyl diphosphate isomerase/L-lactate dehydrogenase-like FMN-dependent dehydrogenase
MSRHEGAGAAPDFLTIPEVIRAARRRMPPAAWDHASGGVESETTLRRNRLAMETLSFRPRLLRGIAEPDLRTTFLGRTLDSPVMLAPIGSIGSFHPDGALAPARVAARRRTMCCVGILSRPSLSEVAAEAAGPLLLQIYVRGDRDWLHGVAQTAEAAGYVGLCLTADSTGGAKRDRDLHNRYQHHAGSVRPNLRQDGGLGLDFQATFCWDDFDWLRSITRLPIILKGVLTAQDALLAVEHGADAIYVSNHGGRELDHLPATLEVLPEIIAAVEGRAEVIVDSGFLRGTDVVKALALGARAVLLGKLQVWGLAAGGESVLEQVLDLLDHEIRETLRLLGVRRLAELTPGYIQPATPTRANVVDYTAYEHAPLPI